MISPFLTAILVPVAFFATIFGIVYIRSRENMALIERGLNPRNSMPRPAPFTSLKIGLLLIGSGLGLCLAFIIDRNIINNDKIEAIYFSLIAVGGGAGLVVSYLIEKKEWLQKTPRRVTED